MKQLLLELIKELFEIILPEIKEREAKPEKFLDWNLKKIIPIIGFRRVGKTYLLLSIAKKLGKENTLYVNFEDERLNIEKLNIRDFINAVKEIYGNKKLILLLDEVQEIPKWSKWLRTLNDIPNFFVYATGSSSKISPKEIPTELRGRALTIHLFPLSFREYLSFKEIKVGRTTTSTILNELREYLNFGGFPEITLTKDKGKKYLILDEYFQTFVARDVIERYRIRNREAIRYIVRILLNSTYITVSKTYNTLKSIGLKIGKNTVANYLKYLEESLFVYYLEQYSLSEKLTIQSPRKIYLIDTFFITRYSKFSENIGRKMENTVFLELLRIASKNPLLEIYYWKDFQGHEIDFVIKENYAVKELIQVTYANSFDEIDKREWRSLLKAKKLLKCNKLTIITWDYEDTKELSWFGEKGKIKFTPLWRWLQKHQ